MQSAFKCVTMGVHPCRVERCQQAEMAEVLVEAGADALHTTCATAQDVLSSLEVLIQSVPTGQFADLLVRIESVLPKKTGQPEQLFIQLTSPSSLQQWVTFAC